MLDNQTSFCSLYEDDSIESLLKRLFSISNSRLKSFRLKKEFLKKNVRAKDEITISLDIANHQHINPRYTGPSSLKIIGVNSHNLFLSKPSFCHIHPLSYGDTNNTLSYLRECTDYHHFLAYRSDSYDRSLVYRLDYETSGVVLLSLENVRHDVDMKCYFAVVEGKFNKKGKIEHPISRTGKKIKLDTNEENVTSLMFPLEYNESEDKTLVAVFLEEGRRHQIRVQMSLQDHPIVGDTLYGGKVCDSYFGLHSFCYQVNGTQYKDKMIPFQSLFSYFLNLDSNFQMLSDEFWNSKGS